MSAAAEDSLSNAAHPENEDYISLALDDVEESSSSESVSSDDVQVDKTVREHAAARSTPWSIDVPWHRCQNAAEMLHAEIETFSKWISPTPEEHSARVMVIQLLQHALHSEWPDADVRSFGSQDTQLYLPQGDIDLVVLSKEMDQHSREHVLRRMAGCLRAHKLARDIQVIARAKVPIIKFVCTLGLFHVDISINQANGLQAAQFVNRWLVKQPAIRPLVMVLKQFLQQRALSEVFTGGLGSYSVTLLVLSFLQLHPKLQRGEISASQNLGVLLMELLELYGKNFGYDYCTIVVRGRGCYMSKMDSMMYDERKPFLLTNDISRGSFAIISVRSALGGAFDILHAALCERAGDIQNFRRRQRILNDRQSQSTHKFFHPDDANNQLHITSDYKEPESLLGSILGASKEMTRRRNEIKSLFESGTLQKRLAKFGHPVDDLATKPSTLPATVEEPRAAPVEEQVSAPANEPVIIPSTGQPRRRNHQDTLETSPESRYATTGTRKRGAEDPWSHPAKAPRTSDSESDEDLVAGDAPYVMESSESDTPPVSSMPKRPAKKRMLNMAGRAKRFVKSTARKLSKSDRIHFWSNKAGSAPSNDE
ncbi:polynucleotide adenylyltransferase [Malassezia caprae]|uniref:polynucleotide adenylyltransferase n=1 Tax=Malassezia caprae TaxID=1381934 RepID=A0AAF0E6F9_9BASI|nr:polynucleotide adenylyltransferase [Malassezia caprae]